MSTTEFNPTPEQLRLPLELAEAVPPLPLPQVCGDLGQKSLELAAGRMMPPPLEQNDTYILPDEPLVEGIADIMERLDNPQ